MAVTTVVTRPMGGVVKYQMSATADALAVLVYSRGDAADVTLFPEMTSDELTMLFSGVVARYAKDREVADVQDLVRQIIVGADVLDGVTP